MHISFIAYGKRDCVELMFRDMEAQKHQLKMWKGEEKISIWIQGQLRLLPFGVYEYVFPREDFDLVLNTLEMNCIPYYLNTIPFKILRRVLKLKPLPKSTGKDKYLWIRDNVALFPIGMREDKEFTDPSGMYEGWTHEAL